MRARRDCHFQQRWIQEGRVIILCCLSSSPCLSSARLLLLPSGDTITRYTQGSGVSTRGWRLSRAGKRDLPATQRTHRPRGHAFCQVLHQASELCERRRRDLRHACATMAASNAGASMAGRNFSVIHEKMLHCRFVCMCPTMDLVASLHADGQLSVHRWVHTMMHSTCIATNLLSQLALCLMFWFGLVSTAQRHGRTKMWRVFSLLHLSCNKILALSPFVYTGLWGGNEVSR